MLCVCNFSYFFNPWFINVSTLVATWYDIWPVIFSNKMTKTPNFKSRVANDGKNYHCYYQDQPVSHFDTCHFTEKWLFFHQTLWFKEIHSMDKSSLPTFSHQCWNFAAIWPFTIFFFLHLILGFTSLCDVFRGVKHLQPRVCVYFQRRRVQRRSFPWAGERRSPSMLHATLLLCSRRHVKRIKEDVCDPTEATACLPGIREKYSQL